MAAPNANAAQSKFSEQYVMNSSFDEAYGVLASVLLAEFSNTVKRLQADTDGNLKVNVAAGGTSGTQYTEGDTDVSITGTAVMWEDESDTLRSVSADKPLPVEIVAGAGSGGTAAADDADFTDGTTSGTPAMGVYEATPTTVTDGDLGIVGITEDRRTKTSATVDAALPAGTNNIGDVDIASSVLPTGAATSAKQDTVIGHLDGVETLLGTIDADTGGILTSVQTLDNAIAGSEMQVDIVAPIPAGTNNIGDVDILSIAAGNNNIGDVDIASALPAGTNAIGKLASNSGVDIGDVTLTAGTSAIGTLLPPDIDITAHTNYARKYYTSTGAATDSIVWSPAAGKRWHVTGLYINVSAAATVTLEDDKSGGDDPVFKSEFAANSGVFLTFPEKYPMASGEDAADLIITTSAGNVYVTVVGYEI